MGTPETSREPCPDRILDDIGGAFGMGAVGGSVFHFYKGLRASPKGERLAGGFQTMRMNAPKTGGSFAVWGGLFSAFDCTMVYLRQKEDPWNSIFAGAATGGFLSMRQGVGPAARSAAFGGVLLGLIEGAGIMLNKVLTPPAVIEDPNAQQQQQQQGQGQVGGFLPGFMRMPGSGEQSVQVNQNGTAGMGNMEGNENVSSSGWFGGWFGGGGKEEGSGKGSESETKVLESFDTPTPMPSFEYK